MEYAETKRIACNTAFLYLRTAFSLIISLYTSRVVLRALGIDNFGIYSAVGGMVAMFALLNAGMTSCIQRYLTISLEKSNITEQSRVFRTSVNVMIIIALLTVIAAESIGLWFLNNKMIFPLGSLSAANWVYQCSVVTFVLGIVSIPYNAALTAHEHFDQFAYIGIFEVILKLAIALTISFIDSGRLVIYAVLVTFAAFCVRYIYTAYCTRHFEECKYQFMIDIPLLKKMFTFSFWNFLGSSSSILKTSGINLLVNLFFGVTLNAAMGIASQITNAACSFAGNFTTAIHPQITKAVARSDYSTMKKLAYMESRYAFLLLYIVGFPLIVGMPSILRLWLGEYPEYAVPFSRLIIINIMIDTMAMPLIVIMLAVGRIALYQICISAILLLNVPISYLCFRYGYSPESSYIVGISLSVIAFFSRFPMINRFVSFPFQEFARHFFPRSLSIVLVSFFSIIGLQKFLPYSDNGEILLILIAGILGVLFSLFIGVKKEERSFIWGILRRKLLFNKNNK